jgi:hypothetical protein
VRLEVTMQSHSKFWINLLVFHIFSTNVMTLKVTTYSAYGC